MDSLRGVRVLHIWNTGGVASIVAESTDRLFGTKSRVITRKSADPMGLTTFGSAYGDGAARFFLRAIIMSRGADIVHVHSLDRVVPWLKRFYPRKPVVLYYLGSDIRGRWKEERPRWGRADLVSYTTTDLSEGAPNEAIQVFCPIDTRAFSSVSDQRKPNSALSIKYGMDEEARRLAEEMSLELTMIERGSVPYSKMPELFSKFDYFLDLRRPPGRLSAVECLGKAALEALASGCRAVDWSGKVYSGLPHENRPEEVASRWVELYHGLLKEKGRLPS